VVFTKKTTLSLAKDRTFAYFIDNCDLRNLYLLFLVMSIRDEPK
jgi:hypothetical protein